MKLRPGTLLAVALFIMACTSSCKREYICHCEIVYSGQPGLPDTVTREYFITDTKKKAESACKANSSKTEKQGITTEETCGLY